MIATCNNVRRKPFLVTIRLKGLNMGVLLKPNPRCVPVPVPRRAGLIALNCQMATVGLPASLLSVSQRPAALPRSSTVRRDCL